MSSYYNNKQKQNSRENNSKNNIFYNINSIFKQVNANIITNIPRKNSSSTLNLNQPQINKQHYRHDSNLKPQNKYKNNPQFQSNGTLEADFNPDLNHTQIGQFYDNKVNKIINEAKHQFNRYNSNGRMRTLNSNNNNVGKKSKEKCNNNKINNGQINGYVNYNNNHIGVKNNTNQYNKVNKKKINIPSGNNNNKYKTIGESNIRNYKNDLYNNNYTNRTLINEKEHKHNTIDLNNLYSGKQNIVKKYNMTNTNNKTNYKNNIYNNNTITHRNNSKRKTNVSPLRPRTPDFHKKEKTPTHCHARTPDRQRNKSKLTLNKEYLYTNENRHPKKGYYNNRNNINGHTNYTYRLNGNNRTIEDNNNDYFFNKTNTNINGFYKGHKKNMSNYGPREFGIINNDVNNHTLNKNNTNSNFNNRKNSYKKLNEYNSNFSNNKNVTKTLSKNASQGNIHSNYNKYKLSNINHNNNLKNNTTMATPIKYNGNISNYKGELMTQFRPNNNYNIYEETFQSFGKKVPNSLYNNNNNNYNSNRIYSSRTNNNNNNQINYNNNTYLNSNQIKQQQYIPDPIINKNNNYLNNYKNNTYLNNNTYKNTNNNTFIQNNNINKTSINKNITSIGSEMTIGSNIQSPNCQLNECDNNFIDFNDLDQFSPPNAQLSIGSNKNGNSINPKNGIKYTNIGLCKNDNSNNYYSNYTGKNDNNRKVIDEFVIQMNANKQQQFLLKNKY